MMNQMVSRRNLRRGIPVILFLVCVLAGAAGGLLMRNMKAGICVGMGAGFILMAVMWFILSEKKRIEETEADHPSGN